MEISHNLKLYVIDKNSGLGIPVKAQLRSISTGEYLQPAEGVYCYSKINPSPIPKHSLFGTLPYFYFNKECDFILPEGKYVINIYKGFEYKPIEKIFELVGDLSLSLEMELIVDFQQKGWFSGDNHVHCKHEPVDYHLTPYDLKMIMEAEDLQVATWLEDEIFPLSDEWQTCGRNYAFSFGVERGHYSLMNLNELPPENLSPTYNIDWYAMQRYAKSKGAVISMGHPINHNHLLANILTNDMGENLDHYEAPLAAFSGIFDVYDLRDSNVETLQSWYDMLNCGLKIPLGAGSDMTACSSECLPIGNIRVFVHTWDFSYNSWLMALKAGNSFVTNGPLLEVEINNKKPGTIFNVDQKIKLHFEIKLLTPAEDLLIEVLRNGKPVWKMKDIKNNRTIKIDISEEESCWYAVRCYGKDNPTFRPGNVLFAHTSPFYIESKGNIYDTESCERLRNWCKLFFAIRYPRPASLEPKFKIDQNPDLTKIFPFIENALKTLNLNKTELCKHKDFLSAVRIKEKFTLEEPTSLENSSFYVEDKNIFFSRVSKDIYKYSGVFWDLKLTSGIYKIEASVKSKLLDEPLTPWSGDGLKITVLDENGKCLGQSMDMPIDDGMRSCLIALPKDFNIKIIYIAEISGNFFVSYPRFYKIISKVPL